MRGSIRESDMNAPPQTDDKPGSPDAASKGRGPWGLALLRFRKSRMGIAGAIIVLVMVLAGLFAPWLAPHRYDVQFREDFDRPPSRKHLLGVDPLARDSLSRATSLPPANRL